MVMSYSVATRNALLAAVAAKVDGGSGPGYLEIRSGSRPATVDTAATGTLLVTIVFADPAFGTPSAGAMAIDADPDLTGIAVASGTASWGRAYDSNDVAVMDGSVFTSASDFNITTTAVVSGQTVTLLSGALSTSA